MRREDKIRERCGVSFGKTQVREGKGIEWNGMEWKAPLSLPLSLSLSLPLSLSLSLSLPLSLSLT